MSQAPFFSIIMPFYNAAAYLPTAVGSLMAQTYGDFELLLINDGSTDGSLAVASELAAKDKRIVLLSATGSGVSAARNVGLAKVRGTYIGFVDADDYIDNDVLAIAAKSLRKAATDCLKYGCTEEYFSPDGRLLYSRACRPPVGDFTTPGQLKQQIVALEQIPLFGYTWNGFYRAALINETGMHFDETCRVNEDFMFNMAFFRQAKTMRCIDHCGYHYAKRGQGSLSSQSKNYNYDVHMAKVRCLWQMLADEPDMARQKSDVLWLYTRFAYAALGNAAAEKGFGHLLATVQGDELFKALRSADFSSAGTKRRLLIALLQKPYWQPFLYLAVRIIYSVKNSFPTLFAKLKR